MSLVRSNLRHAVVIDNHAVIDTLRSGHVVIVADEDTVCKVLAAGQRVVSRLLPTRAILAIALGHACVVEVLVGVDAGIGDGESGQRRHEAEKNGVLHDEEFD